MLKIEDFLLDRNIKIRVLVSLRASLSLNNCTSGQAHSERKQARVSLSCGVPIRAISEAQPPPSSHERDPGVSLRR